MDPGPSLTECSMERTELMHNVAPHPVHNPYMETVRSRCTRKNKQQLAYKRETESRDLKETELQYNIVHHIKGFCDIDCTSLKPPFLSMYKPKWRANKEFVFIYMMGLFRLRAYRDFYMVPAQETYSRYLFLFFRS